jgi:hypothetical protein
VRQTQAAAPDSVRFPTPADQWHLPPECVNEISLALGLDAYRAHRASPKGGLAGSGAIAEDSTTGGGGANKVA